MCSFITQHNATDVASFEGACNWHADCRNVHQSCCPWIECSFLYHKPSPKEFQRIWQYIQPASQLQTTCNHTSPGPPHPASSPPRSSETSHPDAAATIGLHNRRLWHFGEVFSSRMNPGFHCTGQMADSVYGVVWVSGLLMSTLWIEWPMVVWGYGMGRRMLWTTNTGAFYWCILNAQRSVTRSWGPLLGHSSTTITSCCSMIMHGPMLQGSVHNSWKLKTSQFLHGQHTHRTCHPLSMFGMLWIDVYDSVFQFLPISSNFAQPLKRSGPTFHRPQSTTWSTLCEGDVLHRVRQMVVTPDTDWFSDPPNTVKLHILEWPFIVASLRHTCAIIMLSNQHLDMPHLWGGWIISAKEKCSLTQI